MAASCSASIGARKTTQQRGHLWCSTQRGRRNEQTALARGDQNSLGHLGKREAQRKSSSLELKSRLMEVNKSCTMIRPWSNSARRRGGDRSNKMEWNEWMTLRPILWIALAVLFTFVFFFSSFSFFAKQRPEYQCNSETKALSWLTLDFITFSVQPKIFSSPSFGKLPKMLCWEKIKLHFTQLDWPTSYWEFDIQAPTLKSNWVNDLKPRSAPNVNINNYKIEQWREPAY